MSQTQQFDDQKLINQPQALSSKAQKQMLQISDHLSQYYTILRIDPQSQNLYIQHQLQQLKRNQHYSFKKGIQIKILCHSLNYEMLTLDVSYGHFNKQINIININKTSPTYSLKSLGRGNYGQIFGYQYNNQNFAIKCVQFDDDNFKLRIKQVIKEYMMLLIAADFQIGPKMIRSKGFDIAIYYKSIQFSMQKCIMLDQIKPYMANQITKKLHYLHLLNIVHFDIKPQNIGFSQAFKSLVFLDYGFSRFLEQRIGYKSLTYFNGTYDYCSSEMVDIFGQRKIAYIDLYYNDAFGLQKSLPYMLANKIYQQSQQQDNLLFQIVEPIMHIHHLSQRQNNILINIKFQLYSIAFSFIPYNPTVWEQHLPIINKYYRQIKQMMVYLPIGQFYNDIILIINQKKFNSHPQLQPQIRKHYYQSLQQNQNFIYRYNVLNNLSLSIQDDFFFQKTRSFEKHLLLNKDIIKKIPKLDYYGKIICFIKINGLAISFQQIHKVCNIFHQILKNDLTNYDNYDSFDLYKICIMQIMFICFQEKSYMGRYKLLKQLIQTLIILQILGQSQLQELYLKILHEVQSLFMKIILVFQIIISLQYINYKFNTKYNYQKMKKIYFFYLKNYLDKRKYTDQGKDKDIKLFIKMLIDNKREFFMVQRKKFINQFNNSNLINYQRQFLTKTIKRYNLHTISKISIQLNQQIDHGIFTALHQQYDQDDTFNEDFPYYLFQAYLFHYNLQIFEKCRRIYRGFIKNFGPFQQRANFTINIYHILSKLCHDNTGKTSIIPFQTDKYKGNISQPQYQYLYESYIKIIDTGVNIHEYLQYLIPLAFFTANIKYQNLIKQILKYNTSKILQLKMQENYQHNDNLHMNPLNIPVKSIINIIMYFRCFHIYNHSYIDQLFHKFKQNLQSNIRKLDCWKCKVVSLINYKIQMINYYSVSGQLKNLVNLLIQLIIFSLKDNHFKKYLIFLLQNLMCIAIKQSLFINQIAVSQLIYDLIICTQSYPMFFNTISINIGLLPIYKLIQFKYDVQEWLQLILRFTQSLAQWKSANFSLNFYNSITKIILWEKQLISANCYGYHQKVIAQFLNRTSNHFNSYTCLYFLPFLQLKIGNQFNKSMIKHIVKSLDLLNINTKIFIIPKHYKIYLRQYQMNQRKRLFLTRKNIRLKHKDNQNIQSFIQKWKLSKKSRKNNLKYKQILNKLQKFYKNMNDNQKIC